jgi:hypothetical protein
MMRMTRRIGLCTLAFLAYAGTVVSAGNPKPNGEYYAFLYLGDLATNETASILDQQTDSGSAGGGWGWRFHPLLTFEFDASLLYAEYELPRGVGRPDLGDEKLELSTVGVLGNLKFGPRLGRLRPFVGVGLGFGVVDVSVTNPDLWLPIPIETELSLLTQALAGLDVRVSRRSYLGIECRNLVAHRTIHFVGEEVDAGGRSVALVYRFGM